MGDNSIEDLAEEEERRRGRKPGVTMSEVEERNLSLIRDRGRGLPWATLARKYDLSVRHCQKVYEDWRLENQSSYQGRMPIELVHMMLDRLESWTEQLAEIADQSDGDGTKIAAVNSQMAAMTRAAELMQATGILPHNLGTLRLEMDVQVLALRLVQTLNEHDASPELKRAILDSLQPRDALPQSQLPVQAG